MEQLGIDLKEHAPEILRLWREVSTEPPIRLPPEHDLGTLPEIILCLVEVSLLHPHDVGAHEHKIETAVRHGEMRRDEGADERMIFAEFAALREALRRYLATCTVPRWKYREALMRLDMAISVAEQAAVRGYHRRTFEHIGRWDEQIPQLARMSPLLGLPQPGAGRAG